MAESVGGGPSAAGDAGPSAGGTPALIRREEARRNGGRKDAAEWARRRWGDEEDAGVVVPLHDEMGLVKVVWLHFRFQRLRGVQDRENPEERWRGSGGGCRRGSGGSEWRRRRVGGGWGLAGEVEVPEILRLRRWRAQAPLRLSLVHEE